jgi:flagellar basal-body rod modification protein FlgD
MVAPVSTSSSATQAAASSALAGGAQALGEKDFLTLLTAQLKNQDPLQPQDDSAFVAQLAQFSSLEQQMQTNTSLNQIMTQLQGQSNAQLTSLVGKNATIQGSTATLDGSGGAVPITFMLNSASASTTAMIQDSSGNTVRTLDLGAQNAGLIQFNWDGRSSAGDAQPAGNYTITVTATGSSGAPVSVSQNISGTVGSVSFAQGNPIINLQNGVSAPVSELLQVGSPPSNP